MPGLALSAMPPAPKATSSTLRGIGSEVNTTSQVDATWATEVPAVAPRSVQALIAAGLRSNTTTSWLVLRMMLRHMGPPMLPTPMKPTFIVVFPRVSRCRRGAWRTTRHTDRGWRIRCHGNRGTSGAPEGLDSQQGRIQHRGRFEDHSGPRRSILAGAQRIRYGSGLRSPAILAGTWLHRVARLFPLEPEHEPCSPPPQSRLRQRGCVPSWAAADPGTCGDRQRRVAGLAKTITIDYTRAAPASPKIVFPASSSNYILGTPAHPNYTVGFDISGLTAAQARNYVLTGSAPGKPAQPGLNTRTNAAVNAAGTGLDLTTCRR